MKPKFLINKNIGNDVKNDRKFVIEKERRSERIAFLPAVSIRLFRDFA